MHSWFVLKSGTVVGPLTSDRVISSYNQSNNMVWGIPCEEWITFSEWEQQLNSGVFDAPTKSKILINPDLKKEDAVSKVFKINPVETNLAPLPAIPVIEEKTEVEAPIQVEMKNKESVELVSEQPAESVSNEPIEPVSGEPSLELQNDPADMFSLEVVENIAPQENKDLSMADDIFAKPDLNEQLNEFLGDPFIDNAGHTLVQATMDDLSSELMAQSKSDSEPKMDDPTSLFDDFKSESKGESQSEPKVEDLDLLDLNVAQPKSEDLVLDFQPPQDVASVESEAKLDDLSFSIENNDSELSADDIFGSSNVINSNESPDMNADQGVIDISQVIETSDDMVSEISSIDIKEKTNISDLKEFSQVIEQTKLLEVPIWYVAYDGNSEGPINVETLLKRLDQYPNPEFIYLWKKGFKDWQSLFDTPQISSQLGIGFRRHDRHPFNGTVKIQFNGNMQIGQLENLSLSGVGATGFGPLVMGETVKVILDCAELSEEIEFMAKIRFTSELGVLGLSFIKDEYVENINKIINLVQTATGSKKAA